MDDDRAASQARLLVEATLRKVLPATILVLAAGCGGADGGADAGGDAAAREPSAAARTAGEGAIRDGLPDGFPLPTGARRTGPAEGEGSALSPFVVTFEIPDRSGEEATAWLRDALPASGFRIMDDDATTSVASEYEQVASWALQKEGTGVVTNLLVREYPDGTIRLVLRSFEM